MGGTTHLGVGLVSVWGNNPIGHPDNAWKLCYEVETDGAGVFIRTHETSDYVWADQLKHPEPEIQQSVQVFDKKTHEIVKTIRVTEEEGKAALHMEFNDDGTEVWVSVWNRKDAKNPTGEIVVYDAKTLKEKTRIKGLTTPTSSSLDNIIGYQPNANPTSKLRSSTGRRSSSSATRHLTRSSLDIFSRTLQTATGAVRASVALASVFAFIIYLQDLELLGRSHAGISARHGL